MSTEVVTICDASTGATARIAPALGFNCFSFQPVVDGRPIEVLWADPQFVQGSTKPSKSGIPILFPFPGRLRGQRFEHEKRTFEFDFLDDFGNAIHGLVLNRPWEISERGPQRTAGWFQASQFDPPLLDVWPADFRLNVIYEIHGNCLSMEILIENPDERPLPWGLGAHPYFRLPLGGADADACRVTVPNRAYWELNGMMPTGSRLMADGRRDLSAGQQFGEARLDDVLSGLRFEDGICTCSIHDPGSGRTLRIRFDDVFSQCVVFTPPHREAICIEPYTCVPALDAQPGSRNGESLRLLPSGDRVRAKIEFELI